MNTSARCSTASAMRNSRLRALLPPKARPVRSSRLTSSRPMPSSRASRGASCNGVGSSASDTRGTLAATKRSRIWSGLSGPVTRSSGCVWSTWRMVVPHVCWCACGTLAVVMTATSAHAASSVYEELGVRPVINARGNNTVLGGSTPSTRVKRAMQDAERYYVDMQQLLERSGQVIADLLECEAAYVTPGAAAALALGAAACITGADSDKIGRLPDTTGMKATILLQTPHRYHYQRAVTVPGAHVVEVEPSQLEAALGPDVAAVLFPAHLDGAPGTRSLAQVIEAAH